MTRQDAAARLPELLRKCGTATAGGKYLHWDEVRYREPPAGLSREDWWFALKLNRHSASRSLPLCSSNHEPFRYLLVDPIPERLHEIDLWAGGRVSMSDQVTNPETKDQYYVSSLIEEAITSSQLEGAATTRQVARDMLRAGRAPRDRSDRMILNNYLAMRRIGELKNQPLSRDLVFELHRLVTDGTLDDASGTGRFRRPDEAIVVEDGGGEVVHRPPRADQLAERMEAMCRFANDPSEPFIHPVVRAILLHFWLAYDHPFVDGNGRTARALFYWSMLRSDYWLFEFISISPIILQAPAKYYYAFLCTETDENDATYFVLYHLEVIRRALKALHAYIERKTRQLKEVEAELRGLGLFNHRQKALIGHALRHPQAEYSIEGHRVSHNVVYQTARTDLLDLQERGLLSCIKRGKKMIFRPAPDFAGRLRSLDSLEQPGAEWRTHEAAP